MNRVVGMILVGVSAAAFGTLAIFGRFAYADGMDALTIMALRFSLSAAVMMALLAARHESLPRGRDLIRLVGMGAIGYVGQAFSYLTALRYASSGLVALLLYLYPVFVALLSAAVLREHIAHAKKLALGLALLGTALTAGPEGGQLLGILLATTAAAIYSVYIIVGSQVLKRVSALQSSTVIFASAGAVSGILVAAHGPQPPATGSGWLVIVAIVLIATVIPVVTFLAGMQRIGPIDAATLSTLEPVVTVVLAAWLLGEILRPITLLGGALILVAALLLTHGEVRRASQTPASD
jgi:drug/metabolite transporter (DMT)-like permease